VAQRARCECTGRGIDHDVERADLVLQTAQLASKIQFSCESAEIAREIRKPPIVIIFLFSR